MNRGAMYARMNWGAMYARMLSGLRGVDVCHVARAVPRLACDTVGHVVESVRHELGHTVCMLSELQTASATKFPSKV